MMLSSSSSSASPSLKPYDPHSPLRGGGFSLLKMVAPTSPGTQLPSPKFNLPLFDTTTAPSGSLSCAAATASCNFSSPPPAASNSFSFIKNPIPHQNPPPPLSSSSTAAADVQKSNKKFVFRIRTTAYKAAKPNPNPNPNPKNITDHHHPPKSKVMSNGARPAVEGDTIKKLLLLQQGTNDTVPPSGHDDDDDDDDMGFVPHDPVGIPADHCLRHHQAGAGAKPRLIQAKKGNHSKKRKLTLLLTDEEIEEDILFMTGEKPARIPKPNNTRAMKDHNEQKDDPQRNMDKVFPGLHLGSITTKSYRVRP